MLVVSWAGLPLGASRRMSAAHRQVWRQLAGPVRTPNLRFAPLIMRVESRSSYAHGKLVYVDEDGGYSGVTDGMDPRGFLRVHTQQGLRIVVSGGVRPLPRRADATGS